MEGFDLPQFLAPFSLRSQKPNRSLMIWIALSEKDTDNVGLEKRFWDVGATCEIQSTRHSRFPGSRLA